VSTPKTLVARTPEGFRVVGPSAQPGGGGVSRDFSVNEAQAYLTSEPELVLRTSALAPGAGGYNGGGVGNKAIWGVWGLDGLPIAQFLSAELVWTNVVGPAGINYIPAEPTTVATPYLNFLVDFDPLGAGDIRVCVICTDQLNPAINNAVGTQANNGSNELTYSWDGNTQDVLIVGAPPAAVPGGVAPNVSVGPGWFENSYTWQALVAANPSAVLVDAYSGDGGLPAGAITPAFMVISGDSNAQIKQGKRILSLDANGIDGLA